jgi:hypothetical protein
LGDGGEAAPGDATVDAATPDDASTLDASRPEAQALPEAALPTLTLALDRASSGQDIAVTIRLTGDASLLTTAPTLVVTGGIASTPVGAAGVYTATVTPSSLDTEVPITATWNGLHATETALVFATVDSSLGQAVAIDGAVNTPGWEDGVDISSDGQWLLVASYVPIDVLSCSVANLSPTSAACTTIVGPYGAPDRPGMLGAARIAGGTFKNTCPDVGVTTPPATFAFMPTAAFGFHRQTDGSFAEPFVIGFDADGCLGPYGYAFTGAPAGASAGVVFANQDPLQSGAVAHITYAPLTLGQPNILGVYRVVDGGVVETGATTTVLPPMTSTRQGNPFYGGGRLWWDDEDLPQGSRIISFANVTGSLPALSAGPAQTAAIGAPGQEKIQPSLDGQTLYWMGDGIVRRSTLTSPSADPSQAASWSEATALLGPASEAGTGIVAAGEPNVAHVGAATELYFVYIKKTATGYDSNVGKVAFR